MQNAKCKIIFGVKNKKRSEKTLAPNSAFCILHFAFLKLLDRDRYSTARSHRDIHLRLSSYYLLCNGV